MANAVVTVLESDGLTQTDVTVLDVGRQAAASSKSAAACTEDKAVLDAQAASLVSILAKIIAAPATEASLASALTALQIMDDWDETDRAKVNIIAGQAGVAAGAGAVGATVVRVTQASDSPLVTTAGATTDAASGTGNGSLAAHLRQIRDHLATAGGAWDYETVAASQTDQMMGPTGAVGDKLYKVIIIPATTSPGAVSIEDGATNTTIFAGGASSVATLHPFEIEFGGIASVSGGWEITTGANVSAVVVGDFT